MKPLLDGCSVELVEGPHNSAYDLAIGAARTCYAQKAVMPDQVRKDEKSTKIAENIFDGIYDAGHHTTIQHPNFTFILRGVSRHFTWSFLHSHPFYNSEQQSQRYVDIRPENFLIPPFKKSESAQLFEDAVRDAADAYAQLQSITEKTIVDEWYKLYPQRRKDPKKWENQSHKRIIESARYVIPVCAQTTMYHTISGLTLLRYQKMCSQFDTPLENRLVVNKMVALAREKSPEYFRKAEYADNIKDTPECRMFEEFFGTYGRQPKAARFTKEFDTELEGLSSKLVDWNVNAEKTLAGAYRSVFGLPSDHIIPGQNRALSDEEAIDHVLNPAKNTWLSSTLRVNTLSKIGRVMNHVHYTFKKKISHTADSQDQRHRMTPGARPILAGHFNFEEPDCIWPVSYEKNPAAMALVDKTAKTLWSTMQRLYDEGEPWEFVQYLLPNATAIRFYESGDLLNFHHKWTTRLCYLAQEEIWRNCKEEVLQVREKHPNIGKYLSAPCTLRKMTGDSPYCPEGARYCGVPVWTKDVKDYERVI
jgi:flavin-dependent thymidylate synthase